MVAGHNERLRALSASNWACIQADFRPHEGSPEGTNNNPLSTDLEDRRRPEKDVIITIGGLSEQPGWGAACTVENTMRLPPSG